MKKIKFMMNSGFVGTDRSDIFEFEDDATDEEIEGALQEWVLSYIDCAFCEVER